jgi:large subunit ribosomal protein L4
MDWTLPFLHHPILSFQSGKKIGLLQVKKSVFGIDPREDILARCIKYERSWREQGTESSKSRSLVRGSSRKAAPQKGRGKARVRSLRAPQFRGGYAVHGPRPHIKTIDIQKKVYDAGIRNALSAKQKQKQLYIVDRLFMDKLSKSEAQEYLNSLGLGGKKVYFIYGSPVSNAVMVRSIDSFTKKRKSGRNPNGEKPLLITSAKHISVWTLIEYDYVVMDKEAVELLEFMYG